MQDQIKALIFSEIIKSLQNLNKNDVENLTKQVLEFCQTYPQYGEKVYYIVKVLDVALTKYYSSSTK